MTRRWTLILLLCLSCGGLSAQQPDPASRLKRLQRKARLQAVDDPDLKPIAGSHSMETICTVRTVNGRLRLNSPLARSKHADSQIQIMLEGLPEPATVFAEGSGKDLDFRLSTRSFSDPKAISIDIQLMAENGVLSINRSTRYLDGFVNLSFIQAEGSQEETGFEPGVILSVNHHSQKGEPTSENVSAPTFAQLRQSHPDLVNQYLRPVFRDLQLASAFNIELPQAFEVFASQWKPTTEARQKVAALLPRLDDSRPSKRDAALRELNALQYEGALALMHLDRGALSPEVNARLDVLLSPLTTLTESERRAFRRRPHFLCDCLYSDDPRVAASAARQIEQVTGMTVEVDLTQAPVRRAAAVERLRDRLVQTTP